MSNILTNLARHGAEIYGADREAFARIDLDRPGGAGTEPTTWGDFSADVDAVAYALETIGIEPGDMVAVFAPNCPEILLTDFACFRNRAVPVAIYATSSPEQVRFILNDSAARAVVVGGAAQYRAVRQIAEIGRASCRERV